MLTIYNNDFNDDHAEILYKGEETNAWKLTGNKTVDLTLKVGQFEETVEGTISSIQLVDLLKANLPLYGAALLFTVIVIVLIVVLIRIISMNKRRNRRNRYYR